MTIDIVRYQPNYAIPPRETLMEILEDRKITLSRLSKMTGLDYEVLIDIMEVKTKVNKEIADKLESALEIPSSFWVNLEENYQATLKRLSEK